jgi:hypothetical protein
MCEALGVASKHPCMQAACSKLSSSMQVMNNLNTVYKRNKWLANNGYLVKHDEVSLGT